MKKEGFFPERMFPVIFMFVITVVCIAGVSFLYLSTKDMVLLNESLFLKKSVLYASNILIPGDSLSINEVYQDRVEEVKGEDDTIDYFRIKGEEGDATEGYVVFQDGPGLWGSITAVIGYKNDLETLTGIDFIYQNETPGLGARIMESWFREQFRGKRGPFSRVPEGTSAAENEFDAITGATRTSAAVEKIVNNSSKTVVEAVRK